MKELPNLPLEPTYNKSLYPKLPQKPQNPSFPPIISPHIPLLPLKIQNFNGYISNFEHFIITISSKYMANMKEHPNLPLEPTYNQSSYPKLP